MNIVHDGRQQDGIASARWDRKKYRGPMRGWGIEEGRQSDVSAYSRAKRKRNTESAWSVPPRPSNIIYSLSHSEHPLTTYLHRRWQEQKAQNWRHSKKPHVETNARSERNTHNWTKLNIVRSCPCLQPKTGSWLQPEDLPNGGPVPPQVSSGTECMRAPFGYGMRW